MEQGLIADRAPAVPARPAVGMMIRAARAAEVCLYWVSWTTGVLGAVVVLLIALLITVSVVARDVFGIGLVDAVTPGRMGITLSLFLGIAWALRQDKHVTVHLVIERLPHRWRHGVRASMMSVAVVAVCVLIWQTWQFALAALRLSEVIVGDILFPAFPFQAAIPAGLTLLALEMVCKIVRDVASALEDRAASGPREGETCK